MPILLVASVGGPKILDKRWSVDLEKRIQEEHFIDDSYKDRIRKELEKESMNQTINGLSMAAPYSSEEKQILLETKNIIDRKEKLENILKTYVVDNFSNTTIQ